MKDAGLRGRRGRRRRQRGSLPVAEASAPCGRHRAARRQLRNRGGDGVTSGFGRARRQRWNLLVLPPSADLPAGPLLLPGSAPPAVPAEPATGPDQDSAAAILVSMFCHCCFTSVPTELSYYFIFLPLTTSASFVFNFRLECSSGSRLGGEHRRVRGARLLRRSTARASALTPPRTAMPRTAALRLVRDRARLLLESEQAPEPNECTIEKSVEGGGVDQVTYFTIFCFVHLPLPPSLSRALYFSFSLIFVADLLVADLLAVVLHSPPPPSPCPPRSPARPSLAIVNVLLLALQLVLDRW